MVKKRQYYSAWLNVLGEMEARGEKDERGKSPQSFLGGPMPKANAARKDDDDGGSRGGRGGGNGNGSGGAFQVRGKFAMAVAHGGEEEEAIEVVLREPDEPNLFLERIYQVPMSQGGLTVAQNAPMEMTFAEAAQRSVIGTGGGGRESTPLSQSPRNTRARYI